MRYNIYRTRQAVQTINVVCCLLFVFFCFVYLFFFQTDLLNIAQHVYSHGRTTFHAILYSSLITTGLTVIGLVITYYIHVPIRAKALLWFPSFWILGLLTDIHIPLAEKDPSGLSVWWFILSFLLFLIVLLLVKQYHEDKSENSSFSTLIWPNLFILFLSLSFTCIAGNTNRELHEELSMEELAAEGDFDELLDRSLQTSTCTRSMMYTRAYALSKKGELGECLFQFPNNIGSDNLLPLTVDSLRPSCINDLVREHLGGLPIHDMNATRFFQYMAADSLAQPSVHEYLLCALLLDRRLDVFVDTLLSYYSPKDTIDTSKSTKLARRQKKKAKTFEPIKLTNLPRHYAEALLLYSRMTKTPKAILDDDEILENYLDFLKYFKAKTSPAEREENCRNYYSNTYWFYYFYGNKR